MHDMTHDPDAPIALNAAVEQIKQQFLRDLDERILDLEALRQMVVRGDRPDQALAEIVHRAHKIRGVAATFGLHALGEAAAKVDDTYSTTRATWPTLAPLIETLLDQMERALG